MNRKWLVAKLIRSLYFKYDSSRLVSGTGFDFKGVKHIKFKWTNKCLTLKRLIVCCRKDSRKFLTLNDRLYWEGEKIIKNNLNVFQILQSIDKLKVAVSILLHDKNDPNIKE